jgi:hypothetical protein
MQASTLQVYYKKEKQTVSQGRRLHPQRSAHWREEAVACMLVDAIAVRIWGLADGRVRVGAGM